jgi:GxxExxY protein
MAELLYKDESYKIIGACFEVYNQKGYGFIEPVYQECLQIEFAMQNIPFVSQPEIQMSYKGTLLNQYFKPDFICYGKIIVEIKSVATILAAHRAQAINYLKATEFELALLVNFGRHPKLDHERLAKSKTLSILDEIRSWTEGSEVQI